MDHTKIIADLEELRAYINNLITDAQAVCRVHDNKEQVNEALYALSGAARDLIMLAGFHTK